MFRIVSGIVGFSVGGAWVWECPSFELKNIADCPISKERPVQGRLMYWLVQFPGSVYPNPATHLNLFLVHFAKTQQTLQILVVYIVLGGL